MPNYVLYSFGQSGKYVFGESVPTQISCGAAIGLINSKFTLPLSEDNSSTYLYAWDLL